MEQAVEHSVEPIEDPIDPSTSNVTLEQLVCGDVEDLWPLGTETAPQMTPTLLSVLSDTRNKNDWPDTLLAGGE